MPVKGDAVIIVPTQGSDHQSFQSVAQALKTQVYRGKAVIVYAQIIDNKGKPAVNLYKDKKLTDAYSFNEGQGLTTVMTISHGFVDDGPNFAFGDASVPGAHHQPWSRDTTDNNQLSVEAKSFWTNVGKALRADGKIILLGCSMGKGDYDDLVASASGHTIYAANNSLGAGNKDVAIPTVRGIEKGRAPKIMNRVNAQPSATR